MTAAIGFPQGPLTDDKGVLSLEWFMYLQNLIRELQTLSTMTSQSGITQFIPGVDGEDGEDGSPGPPGTPGPPGANGVNGVPIPGQDGEDAAGGLIGFPTRVLDSSVSGVLTVGNGGTGFSAVTANEVVYATGTNTLGTSANFTFDGSIVTAANIKDSGLTTGRITTVTASGQFTDYSTLKYDGTTFVFTGTNAVFGATTAQSIGTTPAFQVHGTGIASTRGGFFRWQANTAAYNIQGFKSRGATVGTNTVVQSGDNLLGISAFGADGTTFAQAGSITFICDGTPGTNDMPGRIEFATTPDGSAASSLALTLNNSQNAIFTGTVIASNLTAWTSWTPTRTGWTDVGAPTVTARYCQVRNVVHFQIKVVPATTVATVGGTSYTDLPLTAAGSTGDGSMMNLTTLVGVGNVVIDVANSRCYVPTQTASANTLTIAGWYET